MKRYILPLMVMAATASAQIIELDFNDQEGNPSLENRGSESITFAFSGFGGASSEKPTYSETVPSVNSGGRSAYFNQVNPTGINPLRQYINGGSVPSLDNLVSMTLTGWFYHQPFGDPPNTSSNYLFNKSNGDNAAGFWTYRNSSGLLVFQAGSATALTFSESSATPSEQWVFFAITLDASSDTDNLKLYIGNGETLSLADTQDYAITDGHIGTTEAMLWLGNNIDRNRGFSGYFDNFRIYGSTTDGSGVLDLNQLDGVMKFNDVIPEPKSIGMLSVGLLMLVLAGRKKVLAAAAGISNKS